MVASLIMRYLKNNSQKIYIPYATGWTQNEKGAWKLTKPNELTMKEILKNHCPQLKRLKDIYQC